MTPPRFARRLSPLLLAAALLGLAVPASAAPASAHHGRNSERSERRAPGELTISAQDFALQTDDVFDVTVGLPPGFDTATLGGDGSASALVVRVHGETSTLALVRGALDGDLTRVADTIEISLAINDADPRVVRASATELTVSMQTESTASGPDALRLPTRGVFPVSIELEVDGERAADVTTFVARADDAAAGEGATSDDLAVGIVLGTTAEPTIAADGGVEPSRSELAELGLLADALIAIDEAAVAAGVDAPPRAVLVQPSTLSVLPDVDAELAGRLVPTLENGDVIARPRLPFDPSSAITADRIDLYTRLLREGEDALANALPSTRVDRSILAATAPISAGALALRRDLGTQLVILPYERYVGLDGSIDRFTDTSQLLAFEANDGTEMPVMLIDPTFSELFSAEGEAATISTAVALVAQLVALARQLDAGGGSVSRHGVVLAREDGGVPDARLLGMVTTLLLATDGVRVVEPSDLASIVDTQIIDGRPLRVTPVATAGVDLRRRFDSIDAMARDVFGTASMLPEDESLVGSWTRVLDAVVSTALDDAEADEMLRNLRDQIDEYRNGVQGPEPYSFRFTGRSGSIKFKLRNLTDRPLTVRITMTSAKLEFRDADRRVELPPLQETEVTMPFEALSNGTSSVFLRIFTPAPEPSAETQIVDDIILTARVTTLTGLGQLVTGAALLVLCTWWLRHWRQVRRRRLADAVAPRHPAAARAPAAVEGVVVPVAAVTEAGAADIDTSTRAGEPVGAPSGDGAPLAPDAAASTLPPS